MAPRYFIETLGCPKNQVDSDKLEGLLRRRGYEPGGDPGDADLVVVNTCAFVEDARRESIDTILALADRRRPDARLVVTGCLAERHGDELAAALPEVDRVAGFGVDPVPSPEPVAVELGAPRRRRAVSTSPATSPGRGFDLLELPRPASPRPWAYVKVAEGCDRACGFCAIPSFRGPQRSRSIGDICAEVEALDVREVVLVAQDLASYGRDGGRGRRALTELVTEVDRLVDRVRLLYLYPSELSDELIEVICATGVPYFDLSLQHVSRPLLRRMRRWGDGERFRERMEAIRRHRPDAVFRSNFIVGYPGETEDDHDALLRFLDEAELDWCGFFAYSAEEGTYATGLDGAVDPALAAERLDEAGELQDAITRRRRDALVGSRVEVLVDEPGVGRSYREAPEIDGVVHLPPTLEVGTFVEVVVTGAEGPDLEARPVGAP